MARPISRGVILRYIDFRLFSSTPQAFRKPRESPGSEAIFNHELKSMKNDIGIREDKDHEDALKTHIQDHERRGTAMKYAKQAKFFGVAREKRILTWDNIDKIRFLRQQHADDWPIDRLAESFDVSKTVIKKVLKSKFTPDTRTRKTQDLLAVNNAGKETKGQVSEETSLVQGFENEISNLQQGKQRNFESSTFSKNIVSSKVNMEQKENSKANIHQVDSRMNIPVVGQDLLGEEVRDFNLDEELEEAEGFSTLRPSDFVKVSEDGEPPPKVIQRGREFFDEDGEFLFRI